MAGETVTYKDGETTLEGYLAKTDKPNAPVVIIFHQWMGLTDYEKGRADQLVKEGYNAFAADMYGKGQTTDDPKQAGAWMTPIKEDRQLMRRRALLAVDEIKKSDKVDSGKLAAIGYCFGGTCVLELARAGTPLKGVVSFHGGLEIKTPAAPGEVKAKVLALTGGSDSFVPAEQVEAFAKEMTDAKADWQFLSYGGAVHCFAIPSADGAVPGCKYDPPVAKRAFAQMHAFFAEAFASRN